MEMVAIFDFRALSKVHTGVYNFKPVLQSEKLHIHRRHINKHTYMSVFSFVEYYMFNSLCEKHQRQHFRFVWGGGGEIFMF